MILRGLIKGLFICFLTIIFSGCAMIAIKIGDGYGPGTGTIILIPVKFPPDTIIIRNDRQHVPAQAIFERSHGSMRSGINDIIEVNAE